MTGVRTLSQHQLLDPALWLRGREAAGNKKKRMIVVIIWGIINAYPTCQKRRQFVFVFFCFASHCCTWNTFPSLNVWKALLKNCYSGKHMRECMSQKLLLICMYSFTYLYSSKKSHSQWWTFIASQRRKVSLNTWQGQGVFVCFFLFF